MRGVLEATYFSSSSTNRSVPEPSPRAPDAGEAPRAARRGARAVLGRPSRSRRRSGHPLWRLAEAFGARCVRAHFAPRTARGGGAPNLGPEGGRTSARGRAAGKLQWRWDRWMLTSAASFIRRRRLHAGEVGGPARAHGRSRSGDEASREASSVFFGRAQTRRAPRRFDNARRGREEHFPRAFATIELAASPDTSRSPSTRLDPECGNRVLTRVCSVSVRGISASRRSRPPRSPRSRPRRGLLPRARAACSDAVSFRAAPDVPPSFCVVRWRLGLGALIYHRAGERTARRRRARTASRRRRLRRRQPDRRREHRLVGCLAAS